MQVKERRKKLGLSRQQLSDQAYVSVPSIQQLELGNSIDALDAERLTQTLDALEAGTPVPDWKQEVDARIAKEQK